MKKFLFIFASLFMLAVFSSCDNSTEDMESYKAPKTVTVKLDCSINTNTTRATSNDLYTQLYNKVVTKELLAENYRLTFKNTNTGEIFNFKGDWKKNNTIAIKSGQYQVVGESTNYGASIPIHEKCSIRFNTYVTVSASTSNITLKADYDCFLVIFDKKTITNAYLLEIKGSEYKETHFYESDGVFYGFSKKLYDETAVDKQYLVIDFNGNEKVSKESKEFNLENGKYYIFDENSKPKNASTSQTTSIVINKMTCGTL